MYNLYFVFFWLGDLMWITSMANHGAVGGISERRRSSCSSFILLNIVGFDKSEFVATTMFNQKDCV